MRLLNVHSLTFADYHFEPDSIPKYVIASHRWLRGAEATLDDVQAQRGTDKAGYQKVLDFAGYTKSQISGVDWIWIDTCCIDNRNSQEVSTAINSMFRWYARAEVCLAYLQDVDSTDPGGLCRSEWWTRAWTLQELLAPSTVVFLTNDWQVIGHKGSRRLSEGVSLSGLGPPLEIFISNFTGLPENVLRDYNESTGLQSEVKLAWAKDRKASREEDLSYCLLGLLDVAMVANYGEGGGRARRRLMKEVAEVTHEAAVATGHNTAESASIGQGLAELRIGAVNPQEQRQRLLEKLHFPQVEARKDQIDSAYQGTYQWILHPAQAVDAKWDNLMTWLQDTKPVSTIYWINGKPGAGKSKLLRFLEENLKQTQHMQPWCQNSEVLVLSFYFWGPGNILQKTLEGMMRTILYQIMDRDPNNLLASLPPQVVAFARDPEPAGAIPVLELRQCLSKSLSIISPSFMILFLIDGLDEIEGDDNDRDELISILRELAGYPNVKLCVSSRRWTVFQDQFNMCPQLRLEDLNTEDIAIYVRGQLQSQERFRQMLSYGDRAEHLVDSILQKAEGVFLWTRLVVKDLLRGVRDGDDFDVLQHKVRDIPGDLHDYFKQIIESIDLRHRTEACSLLQIALYKELKWPAMLPLRLLDLIFISHGSTDFALTEHLENYASNIDHADRLIYTLDSALRMLSSRCKGLLECYFHAPHESNTSIVPRLSNFLIESIKLDKAFAFDLRVDFMHRSLRDFILEPDQQRFLHQYTDGLFDVRNYLRNARLCELFVCRSLRLRADEVLGLASNFACSLSSRVGLDENRCARFAKRVEPAINYVSRCLDESNNYWYITECFGSWTREHSNLETLAIDFNWTGYLDEALTTTVISTKLGRPILDYILRPRFSRHGSIERTHIANSYPSPDLVQKVLALGADPNEIYGSFTVWIRFLLYVAGGSFDRHETTISSVAASIAAMIRGGAALYTNRHEVSELASMLPPPVQDYYEQIPVTMVFDCLYHYLDDAVDELTALAEEQEARNLARAGIRAR